MPKLLAVTGEPQPAAATFTLCQRLPVMSTASWPDAHLAVAPVARAVAYGLLQMLAPPLDMASMPTKVGE